MIKRVMAVVLSIMLLLTAALSTVSLWTMRNQEINGRLDDLKKEAREIAWLAAQHTGDGLLLGGTSSATKYLSRKAQRVNNDYGAYILVVDRWGRVMDNLRSAYGEDPSFVASLNSKELTDALNQVLAGEELFVRANVNGNPTFTVGVPFVQNERVLGAVLIQTKAQVIEGGVVDLLLKSIALAMTAMLAAAVVLWLMIRRVMQPLFEVTGAAKKMADGDFTVRVEPQGNVKEMSDLAVAFNTMADKLGEVEKSRREFVANVSHELRSPITSIHGFVEGMEDGTIPPEEHGKYLHIVGSETHRLTKLINDLLSLSRLERDDAALTMREFDMCEMLRRAIIRRVNDLETKHMEVECRFPEEPCMVLADSDRIEQVVINLLDNAIKFTPEGGTISLNCVLQGDTYLTTVTDNGIGIAPEDRSRVFERFFTEDRAHTSGKGTGLGLSICQRIMEMHGQTIRLLDTETGASFGFTLKKAEKKES